jgi:hypothetical protein
MCLTALPSGAAEPLADVLACRAIAEPAARLACFDRETAALASAPSPLAAAPAPAAPNAAPAERAPPVLDSQQTFGLNGTAIDAKAEAAGARTPKVSKIDAHVSALALAGDGRTIFTLDNAQVWLQLQSSDRDMLAKLGDAVTVSRGMLGSYWLQLKSGRGCKVTRLR